MVFGRKTIRKQLEQRYAPISGILVIAKRTKSYRSLCIVAGIKQMYCFIIFLLGDNYCCQNDYKRYASTHNRRTDDKCFFALPSCLVSRNSALFSFALCFKPLGLFFCLDFFNSLLTSTNLFVRILPAGNRLEHLNRFFTRSCTILGYFGFCGGVNSVLAADFRLIKTTLSKGVGILKAGNALESISSRSVGILRICAAHCICGIVINSG